MADFCTTMPVIESLNPLYTLHDSLGLTQVEEYLDKITTGTVSTPVGTPTRKPPARKLHLKSSTHKQVERLEDSTTCGNLDLSDLVADEKSLSEVESQRSGDC